jgi:aconitate hydratase
VKEGVPDPMPRALNWDDRGRTNERDGPPRGRRRRVAASKDSFGARATLSVDGTDYDIFRLDAVEGSEKLPFSLKVLLENLLRT